MIAFGKDDSFGIGMTKGMDDFLKARMIRVANGMKTLRFQDG